jgi:hypothetical protein
VSHTLFEEHYAIVPALLLYRVWQWDSLFYKHTARSTGKPTNAAYKQQASDQVLRYNRY